MNGEWGRQSCLQPPFRRPRRLKAGGSQDWLPHILLITAILTACAPPPPPVAQPKPDPTTETWYAQTVGELAAMSRDADALFRSGKTDEAAAIVTKGQPLLARLLSVPQPTLPAMEAVSDLDDLYARMLLGNRHYSWARTLYRKNLIRWKNWKPQTAETAERLKKAQAGIAECDRHAAE